MNNIRKIRTLLGISQATLAERAGVGHPQVSRWENGQADIPSSRMATIAQALGVSILDLIDPDFTDLRTPSATPVQFEGASLQRMRADLPIYGSALGAAREIEGEAIEQTTLNKAEVVTYAKRPVLLDGNAAAYGLYVAGSSMDPRYRDGDMILVDPKGRVFAGEDVVLYLRPHDPAIDDGEAARAVLVKRLVRRTTSYIELEQYSPAATFRLPATEVLRMDRVIPWQELIS